MKTLDRRTFMLGATVALVAPLAACGGGGTELPPVSNMDTPVAVSKQGVKFAALPQAHQIEVTDKTGSTRRVGGVGKGQGRLNYPVDVAVMGELAYVVETGNHRVQVFDAQGISLGFIGEGVLNYPGGVITMNDEILVSDSRNARIVGFDAQGRTTRVIGEGVLKAPRGLAVTDSGLLVADPGRREILKFALNGELVGVFGATWVLPYDVAADGDQVYVADASSAQVAVLSAGGEWLDAIPLKSAPNYLSFRNGTLYVV